MGRCVLLVILVLGCSSTVEQRTLVQQADGSGGTGGAQPDAGEESSNLKEGGPEATPPGGPEAGDGPTLKPGDGCIHQHTLGRVCILDGGQIGCSIIPLRCVPFELR